MQTMLFLEGTTEAALGHLDQAMIIAQENELEFLITKLRRKKERMHADMEKWVKLAETNAPLSKKIESIPLSEYLQEALKLKNLY